MSYPADQLTPLARARLHAWLAAHESRCIEMSCEDWELGYPVVVVELIDERGQVVVCTDCGSLLSALEHLDDQAAASTAYDELADNAAKTWPAIDWISVISEAEVASGQLVEEADTCGEGGVGG